MRYLLFILPVLLSIGACHQPPETNNKQTVNAIIGDESFEQVYQVAPGKSTSEDLRLTTHLRYVEQKLRNRPTEHLTAEQKQNRMACLDQLRNYWMKGEFPVNSKYEDQRRPCFIDDNGNICAVGYLIEQTAGRAVAEKINEQYQYEYVMDMDFPMLGKWAGEQGFTKKELAMIQPTYGPPPPNPKDDNYISPKAAAYSGIFNGVNIASSIISVANLNNSKMPQAVPITGMVSGSLTTVMGIGALGKSEGRMFNDYPTAAEKTLGMVNIAMGTTTLLLNTYALINNHLLRKQQMSLQSFTYQTTQQNTGMGLKLVKRF